MEGQDKFVSVIKRDDGSSAIKIEHTIVGEVIIRLDAKDTVALLKGLDRTVRPGGVQA